MREKVFASVLGSPLTALKRWEQLWVDNVGGNVFFYGGLNKDGVMEYYTDELPQPDGQFS